MWRVVLVLGVALLATGVVLMHSVGPQTGAPGHGGHVSMAPDAEGTTAALTRLCVLRT